MQTHSSVAKYAGLAPLVLGAMLLAACGEDGSSTSSSPATTSSTTTSSSSTTTSSSSTSKPTSVALSGSPQTSATVGTAYSFQPQLTQGGGTVTFSISGQPSWATFDANTGALDGTPASANIGTSSGITITASNGSTSASVGPFSIKVSAAPGGTTVSTATASLTWTAPTSNTDGTPIENLAGYIINYGTNSSDLSQSVQVAGATTTTYTLTGLTPGTYYFAVVAYTAAGTDSAESNVANASI